MRTWAAVVLLSAAAGTLEAQTAGVNARVATAMRNTNTRYEAAACSADKDLHFKVSSARTYLKTGIETEVEDNKIRALENGERVALEGITQNDQNQSAGAWYYLGRLYLQQGKLAGADSAFDRALALAPDCAEDIRTYRRKAWVALVNPGIEYMQAEQGDSAAALFRMANQIYREEPNAFVHLASLAYDAEDMPTALAYFDSALAIPRTETTAQAYDQAQFNKAIVLLQLDRGAEAVPVLQAFVASHPDDANARKALINAYQAAGMSDSANAVAAQLEAMGVEVERTAVVEDSPFNRAVAAVNEERWADAVTAAEAAVAQGPNNRDAIYILARSHFELGNGAELVKWSRQLLALDPMSEVGLQMLGRGYNLTRSGDPVATRVQLNRMPFGISGVVLTPSAGGATIAATATGRAATSDTGAELAPAGATLTFEFLNADGAVVSSQDVEVPALAAGATHSITATGTGDGIVAWRYKRK